MADLPKIYCWINSGAGTDWVTSYALAEDGHCLATHVSSNDSFARWDSGYGNGAAWDAPVRTDPQVALFGPYTGKRELFRAHYPDGFEVVWVDKAEVRTHEGLLAALEKNHEIGEAEKAKEAEDATASGA